MVKPPLLGVYLCFSLDIHIYVIEIRLFMRNKMITLCPTTYEEAQRMKNFSHWIRQQLMWKTNGYDVETMLKELDRMQTLLSAISMGEKKWSQGFGWVDVE